MFRKVNLKELHIIFSHKSLKWNKCLGIPAAVGIPCQLLTWNLDFQFYYIKTKKSPCNQK